MKVVKPGRGHSLVRVHYCNNSLSEPARLPDREAVTTPCQRLSDRWMMIKVLRYGSDSESESHWQARGSDSSQPERPAAARGHRPRLSAQVWSS